MNGTTVQELQDTIERAWEDRAKLFAGSAPAKIGEAVAQVLDELDKGRLRVAEKVSGAWRTHQWIKKAVLLSFRIEEISIADALRLAGPDLGHVHFADSNRQAAGFGHTDFAPIAEALRQISYHGYASAEILPLPDSDTAARKTIESLRQWFRLE